MEMVVDYKNFKKGSLTQERIDEFKEIAKRMGCRFVLKNAPTLNYDCSIWLDENNEVCGANFHTKKEALDYAKRNLKRYPTAVADLKHWNNKGDDYDYTYYRLKDGELKEVNDF